MTGQGAAETSNTISGGVLNGPVLQGGQFINPTFITGQAVAAPVARAQLPALVSGFTGREAELAQLAGLLDPAAGTEAVVVSAVAGLAGVGKTALAIHAGHAARAAGWFPGGVLFMDLHGYDQAPVQPGRTLDALLRALGVPDEHIPDGTEQRAGLYRSVLAQISDPVLIVADNASSEAQVRPLLPGPGPHRVIVTSRHTLAGLGARLLDVTVLDQEVAVALLDRVLRVARPKDDRISGDPAAARRLAKACGGLPLALQITAALLTADPTLPAGELAQTLADEADRLETLDYDDGSGINAPSVAAAFELSYRQLDADAARVFRLLTVNPGPDVSTAAVVALAGWPPGTSRRILGRLARAHLVEAGSGEAGRWRMHDLLRSYACQLSDAKAGERARAQNRLLGYYMTRARAADAQLRPQAGKPVAAEIIGRKNALAWLDAERPNLIAAVALAAATGHDRIAMSLTIRLWEYLVSQLRFDDLLTVVATSRDCARRQNSRAYEAGTLANLGPTLLAPLFDEPLSSIQDLVSTWREARNAMTRIAATLKEASAYLQEKEGLRLEEAISAQQDAVAISCGIDDRHGEGMALGNLGLALRQAGRFDEAISACQHAAAIFRETGDRHGEGMALGNLGLALRQAGRFDEAISACQHAAAIFRETGDRHGEGMALANLGLALRQAGRFDEAISACQDAAAIWQETGDRHGEGMALGNLGEALRQAGRFDEAISACQHAAAIFRETGDRHGEGMALGNLGLALRQAGRFDEAISAHQDAAANFRETLDVHREGEALANLERAARDAIARLPSQQD